MEPVKIGTKEWAGGRQRKWIRLEVGYGYQEKDSKSASKTAAALNFRYKGIGKRFGIVKNGENWYVGRLT